MAEKILIVEDEAHISSGIKLNFEVEGFEAEIVEDGLTAIRRILDQEHDLIILDVMLPGASGFEVCDKVRAQGSRVPILFLTARGSEDDRVRGLELGGDDYMTKPFSIRELLQRARAILRREEWYRQKPGSGNLFEFGPNRVDFGAYKATTPDGELTLTQKECMLFKLLVENEGDVVDRDKILDHVWGYDRYPSSRTVDNLVFRLRKYFEQDPRNPLHIHTIYGAGYRFTAQPTSE
jgi:two-component system alkaline phosphatase synthesis response regulator PhoP